MSFSAGILRISPFFRHRRCFSTTCRSLGKLDLQDTLESQKTTLTVGSETSTVFQPTGMFVGGFRFGDHSVIGSVALLPHTVLKWKVTSAEEINERSLSIFSVIFPPLELIVIGTGTSFERLDPELTRIMSKRGISLEVLDTKNACGTYNLLQQTKPGLIGAALLPLTRDMRPQLPKPERRKRLLSEAI